MHFGRSYQELWRKHVEIKRPNDGVVYNEFPFDRERMKCTQSPTKRLDLGIRLRSSFILFLFNLIFLTNKVVQD